MLLEHINHLNTKRIILASSSPRRKKALKKMGLTYEVIVSSFPENLDKKSFSHPHLYAEENAKRKALDVFQMLVNKGESCDLLVGCDSIVVLDGLIIEKPSSKEDAVNILSKLSGRTHQTISGLCLLLGKHIHNGEPELVISSEITTVYFTQLTQSMINAYVETGIPFDKAGGYGIQDGYGTTFVEKIEGCYFNVTGFPIFLFAKHLHQLLLDNKL